MFYAKKSMFVILVIDLCWNIAVCCPLFPMSLVMICVSICNNSLLIVFFCGGMMMLFMKNIYLRCFWAWYWLQYATICCWLLFFLVLDVVGLCKTIFKWCSWAWYWWTYTTTFVDCFWVAWWCCYTQKENKQNAHDCLLCCWAWSLWNYTADASWMHFLLVDDVVSCKRIIIDVSR